MEQTKLESLKEFKLVMDNKQIFETCLKSIKELTSEALIKLGGDGLHIVEMDPANVAMMIVDIQPSAFSLYSVKEPVEFFVNVNQLASVIDSLGKEEGLTITNVEDEFKIKINGFKLAIMEFERTETKIPELKFAVEAMVSQEEFKLMVLKCDKIAESIRLTSEQGLIKISADGDLTTFNDEIKTINSIEESKASSKYSIEYLNHVLKVANRKKDGIVLIKFSNDYPLMLDYIKQGFKIKYILAPRVENE